MTDELSWECVLAWRVARQRLAERAAAADWPVVVARVCGLHAQAQASTELTLWARVEVAPACVEGSDAWMLHDDVAAVRASAPTRVVSLLPAFDQYVVAAPRDATRRRGAYGRSASSGDEPAALAS